MLPRELPNQHTIDAHHAAHHTIDTPEQMALQMPVAGIGSRFLALAIDTLIQTGIAIAALFALFLFAFAGIRFVTLQNWIVGFYIAGWFLLLYGYYAIFEILWNGQTPGKRAVGIRVIKDSGRPLSTGETIGRNLMRIVDQLPFFYAVGIVAALFSSRNKRLGDMVAGSILVRESALEELRPRVTYEPRSAVDLAAVSVGALTAEDLALVDAFLARRDHLDKETRRNTAAQIATRLLAKLPPDLRAAKSEEILLESISYKMRSSSSMR